MRAKRATTLSRVGRARCWGETHLYGNKVFRSRMIAKFDGCPRLSMLHPRSRKHHPYGANQRVEIGDRPRLNDLSASLKIPSQTHAKRSIQKFKISDPLNRHESQGRQDWLLNNSLVSSYPFGIIANTKSTQAPSCHPVQPFMQRLAIGPSHYYGLC